MYVSVSISSPQPLVQYFLKIKFTSSSQPHYTKVFLRCILLIFFLSKTIFLHCKLVKSNNVLLCSSTEKEISLFSDEKVFLIESHRKKMLKNKIAHLEADLEVHF